MDKFFGTVLLGACVAVGAVVGSSIAYPAGIYRGQTEERRQIVMNRLGRYVFDEETGGALFEYGGPQYGWIFRTK